MTYNRLFSEYKIGDLTLKNRAVMAPMTRSRAIDNIPNALMAEYYAQRADAGLIITEGTSPTVNGIGYSRIPGIYSDAQVEGWKQVTKAVHDAGGAIFLQLMHCGRIAHPDNIPEGGKMVAPSAIAAAGQMYTDSTGGMQDQPTPAAMTAAEVEDAIEGYVTAAKNAIEAGFDGIELHGANGYLINQFLSEISNQRDDEFGGNAQNRNRFALEVARRTAMAIGAKRVGIRVSPYGAFNDLRPYDGIDEQYVELATELGKLGLGYLHMVDHSAMGAPEVPDSIKTELQKAFGGTFILSGGYDADRAESDLEAGRGDLVAFGRPYLSNPDLLNRFKKGAELNPPNFDTFYTPGAVGYTDYPTLA